MTQEKINKIFQTELGQQLSVLFVTSDDRVFIRYEEAVHHSKMLGLDLNSIAQWTEDYGPTDEQVITTLNTAIDQLMIDHPEFDEENSTGWDMIQTLKEIRDRIPLDNLKTDLLIQTLQDIQSYQLNYVGIARSSEVYKICKRVFDKLNLSNLNK